MMTLLTMLCLTSASPASAVVSVADWAETRDLTFFAVVAQAESYDVIKTNDGTVWVGKILRETEKGYLFRTADGQTQILEFTRIADVQSTEQHRGAPSGEEATPTVSSQPSVAAGNERSARIAEIDARIEALESSRRSLTRPILSVLLGAGMATVGGWAAFFSPAAMAGRPDATWQGGVLIFGGAISVVGGLVWSIINRAHNAGVTDEVNLLKAERRTLESALLHGPAWVPHAAFANLGPRQPGDP